MPEFFDARLIVILGTVGIVVLVVTMFVSRLLQDQRREKYNRVILNKATGGAERASSVILDAEARAMRQAGRNTKRPLEVVNWFAIKRDMMRAGLPQFPPIVYIGAGVMAYALAAFVIAAPVLPDYGVAIAILPFVYLFLRNSVLGIFIEARRTKTKEQMVSFVETVRRAVSVGTAPDEAVAEAIKNAEKPLSDNLDTIRELIDLGYDFIDAINLAADRVDLAEFDIFVASLTAQSNTGGSVAEVLREVTEITRSRLDLTKKIQTMTAEGQFNAILLGALPIGLTIYLRVAQPDYFSALWSSSLGVGIYFATFGLAIFGAWLAIRLSVIRI